MKNVVIFFAVLLIVFFGIWAIKANNPIDRPENAETKAETPWYMSSYTSPTIQEAWKMDSSVPEDYIPVPGEAGLYMVLDEQGKVTAYMKKSEKEDGTTMWEEVNPDVPDNYELIKGSKNRYKVTDKDGNTAYYLYVRNEDDTFAFVSCDEFGIPYYDGTDANIITSSYKNYDGNIYTAYNEDNVAEGYAERTKTEDGNYVWKYVDEPTVRQYAIDTPDLEQDTTGNPISGKTTEAKQPDFYEKSEKHSWKEVKEGYVITYEQEKINTYNQNGDLIFTNEGEIKELERVPVGKKAETPDASLVKDTLDEEYERVLATNPGTYMTNLADGLLALQNEMRIKEGLAPLTMDKTGEAYKLACIRAGDMAYYEQIGHESPMYGTLQNMVQKWGVSSPDPTENVYNIPNQTAAKIYETISLDTNSNNVRMSPYFTEVAIAIVEKNGLLYVAEIYLK